MSISKADALWLLLASLHLLVTALWVVPGHFTVDEGHWHLVVRGMHHGSLAIDNGYEISPGPELVTEFSVVHDGRVFPGYPYLWGIVAAPAYALYGTFGLFLTNAVAFVVAALGVRALARELGADALAGHLAAAILVFGAYGWEYSQAAWPHATALAWALGGLVLAARGYRLGRPALGLAAGLVLGFGVGLRLDLALVGAFGAAALFVAPDLRWKVLGAYLLGLVPGLAVLAWTNHVKFGTWNPLSVGPGSGAVLAQFLPVASLVGGLALGARLLVDRAPPPWRRWALAVGGIVAVVGVGLVAITHAAGPIAEGVFALGVDLRAIQANPAVEPMLYWTADGGITYGGLKKALLQSAPWIAFVPLAAAGASPSSRPGMVACAASVAVWLVAFAPSMLHGGMCFNLRYLLYPLALAGIPVAVWMAAALRAGGSRAVVALGAGALSASGTFLLLGLPALAQVPEWAVYDLPLVLALLVVVLGVLDRVRPGPGPRALVLWALGAGLAWGGCTGVLYDAQFSRVLRASTWVRGQHALELIGDTQPVLLVRDNPHWFWGVLGRAGPVHLARFGPDVDHMRALVDAHQARGFRVVVALPGATWTALHQRWPTFAHDQALVELGRDDTYVFVEMTPL